MKPRARAICVVGCRVLSAAVPVVTFEPFLLPSPECPSMTWMRFIVDPSPFCPKADHLQHQRRVPHNFPRRNEDSVKETINKCIRYRDTKQPMRATSTCTHANTPRDQRLENITFTSRGSNQKGYKQRRHQLWNSIDTAVARHDTSYYHRFHNERQT